MEHSPQMTTSTQTQYKLLMKEFVFHTLLENLVCVLRYNTPHNEKATLQVLVCHICWRLLFQMALISQAEEF